MADVSIPIPADSPDARRYNRIRRWLGIADFVVGFAFLVVLLATGWSGWLRDLAYRMGFQNYSLSVFMYLLLLSDQQGPRAWSRLLRLSPGAPVQAFEPEDSVPGSGMKSKDFWLDW